MKIVHIVKILNPNISDVESFLRNNGLGVIVRPIKEQYYLCYEEITQERTIKDLSNALIISTFRWSNEEAYQFVPEELKEIIAEIESVPRCKVCGASFLEHKITVRSYADYVFSPTTKKLELSRVTTHPEDGIVCSECWDELDPRGLDLENYTLDVEGPTTNPTVKITKYDQ